MKLLPNEEKLITSNGEKVILTNHRIQMTDKEWGKAFTINIFLEDISSVEIKYRSNILFLILGIICILGGFYMAGGRQGNEAIVGGLVLGGLFIWGWWSSRKHTIRVSSDGGSAINFLVEGMGEEKIQEFAYRVYLAKQTRMNQLYKVGISDQQKFTIAQPVS